MNTTLEHPMLIAEAWDNFTATDHSTWRKLFARQQSILTERACEEILAGMDTLHISQAQIPKFVELNEILKITTGFAIVPVSGFIPANLFFQLLSERKFPSTGFIRRPEEMDYLQEPDIFHDIFGHVPLLVNPVFADFMQEFGRKALEAIELGLLEQATSLYWFTVEFGLIRTAAGLRIYGAGITSSKTESIYAVESEIPTRLPFDLISVMQTPYDTDRLQDTYFVTDNFKQIFDALRELDWQQVKLTLAQTNATH